MEAATFSAFVTAAATVALVFATVVLAIYTKKLADQAATAKLTATLEPHYQSALYVDVRIENSGLAPAYDVEVHLQPEVPKRVGEKSGPMPLANISLLRPSQHISSLLCEAKDVIDQEYRVQISWKNRPKARRTEITSYNINFGFFNGASFASFESQEFKNYQELQKIRQGIDSILKGQSRIEVETYDSSDREEERRAQEERIKELRRALDQA